MKYGKLLEITKERVREIGKTCAVGVFIVRKSIDRIPAEFGGCFFFFIIICFPLPESWTLSLWLKAMG
jgi:hypothetical protein